MWRSCRCMAACITRRVWECRFFTALRVSCWFVNTVDSTARCCAFYNLIFLPHLRLCLRSLLLLLLSRLLLSRLLLFLSRLRLREPLRRLCLFSLSRSKERQESEQGWDGRKTTSQLTGRRAQRYTPSRRQTGGNIMLWRTEGPKEAAAEEKKRKEKKET